MRNVKIIATLGPASSTRQDIANLSRAGVNVFRINMSHGSHDHVRELHSHIRSVEAENGKCIAILGDLQGPKLRCGTFAAGHEDIQSGGEFTFDMDPTPGDETRVCLPHPEIFEALEVGATLLVNDGLLRLRVERCGVDFAHCRIVVGGRISNRKGVNVPSVTLPISSLSTKDRADLELLCTLGVDWIALSFVQKPEDVSEAAKLVHGRAKLMSKIEKPVAVQNFGDILELSDGIMIARGDLGVEMPVQQLPVLQKKLLGLCRDAGKPVVVATQMLESMVANPVPTRAEVNDVATAIYDGADAIMLSAETAAGAYPLAAVGIMVDVALEVENDSQYLADLMMSKDRKRGQTGSPLAGAVRELAVGGEVSAICCFTRSGLTAIGQARERAPVPIFALTPDKQTARYLELVWGVHSVVVNSVDNFNLAVENAITTVKTYASHEEFSHIAVTAGVPVHRSGTTNMLRIVALNGTDSTQLN